MNKIILMSVARYDRLTSEKTPTIINKTDNILSETIPETNLCDESVNEPISNKLDRELILVFLSPKMKRRAEALLSLSCLDWDEKGQLIYRGSVVSGTHMVDLVKLCCSQFNHCGIRGYNELCTILGENNVAMSLISNAKLRGVIENKRNSVNVETHIPVKKDSHTTKWITL